MESVIMDSKKKTRESRGHRNVKRRNLRYFGRVMIKPGHCLEETLPGNRRKGRSRISWLDNGRRGPV